MARLDIASGLTVRMPMVFDRDTQDSEAVVSDGATFDPRLVLEDMIDWFSDQANEGISLRSGNKNATQFQPQNLAHPVESRL
jgi:hypothetical protein